MIFKSVQVDNYCKKPDLSIKAILVYGTNDGLVSETIKRLAKTVVADLQDPFAVANLDWEVIKNDSGVLVGEYNAQSLMSGRRLVLLQNGGNELKKVMQEFIAESKSDTLLLVSGVSSLNKYSSLVKYFSDEKYLALVACYEDRGSSLAGSVEHILAENKMTYSPEAFRQLCLRMSNDRRMNLNEIDKLVTYAGTTRHFEADDVLKVVFNGAESLVDDLCYYTFSGMKNKAFMVFNNLLNEGVEEVRIVRALLRHATLLLEIKALMENGAGADETLKKILPGKLYYRHNAAKLQAESWTRDRLFDVIAILYATEEECKTNNFPCADGVGYMLLRLVGAASKCVPANLAEKSFM